MRSLLNVVAIACVAQLIAGSILFGQAIEENGLSSAEIAKQLNATKLTPEQTLAIVKMQTPTLITSIYGKYYDADNFERIADYELCDDDWLYGIGQFLEKLEQDGDGSQIYDNLLRFTKFYVQKRVEACKGQ